MIIGRRVGSRSSLSGRMIELDSDGRVYFVVEAGCAIMFGSRLMSPYSR